VLGFLVTEMDFAKSAESHKSAAEKRDLKKYLFTFGRGPRPKHANRIPRPKVGVSLVAQANVKITAKRLDYYDERTNRERLFSSNR